jgi:WD40 repeat protein/DNA-binding SARP family transcriptional activator
MPSLHIHLLGPFHVTVDGVPVTTFESDKVRALLALLVTEPARPHRRETLAGILWPGYPERSARTNLRHALANLRRAIGDHRATPPFLLTSRQTIQFNRASDAWIDVWVLLDLLESEQGGGDEVSRLERAVDSCRGSYLEGFSLADSPEFEEWALLTRERLQRLAVQALHRLADELQEAGEYERALPYAYRQVELDPWREKAHRQVMRLLVLTGQRGAALAQFETCRRLLAEELGAEPSPQTQLLYERVRSGEWLPGVPAHAELPEPEPRQVGRCPYRGLDAFREEDAPFFFGREDSTARLVEAVEQGHPAIVIVGSSGSGKSSLVGAGLLPRLRQAPDWLIATFRPGESPFRALAGVLLPLLEPELSETDQLLEAAKLAEALCRGDLALCLVVERVLQKHASAGRLLLFADQFEELYTLCPEPGLRQLFLKELLSAVGVAGEGRDSPLVLLIALRADFVEQALAHRPFADALQDVALMQRPMTREELQAAVERPAEKQGAAFEPGLVDRILDDVGEEPGHLPLLEFALTLLWERGRAGWLSHADYEEIGRVEGALARYAEEIYGDLGPADQERARQVFLQLVHPGNGKPDTRRSATRAEIGEENWSLTQYLADKRLAVTGRHAAGIETVELVHEALIVGWDRLQSWIEADRAFRTWQERLRAVMRQWEESGRDGGALLRGAPLALAEGWLAERHDEVGEAEREFIEASIALRERRAVEREAQQKRELNAAKRLALSERRRRNVLLALASVLVVGAAVALVLAAYSFRQRREALRAYSISLAAHARRALDELDTGTALALALKANDLDEPPVQSRRVLLDAAYSPGARGGFDVESLFEGVRGPATALDISRAADVALIGLADGKIVVWDLASGEELDRLTGHTAGVNDIAFGPEGSIALSGGNDSQVILWDLTAGQEIRRLDGHSGIVRAVDISAGGRLAVSGGFAGESYDAPGELIVWSLETGEEVRRFEGHVAGVVDAALSPDGQTLVSSSGDAEAVTDTGTAAEGTREGESFFDMIRWDVQTGEIVHRFGRLAQDVFSLSLTPDGSRVLAGSYYNEAASVWDVATGERLLSLDQHPDAVRAVAFASDGRRAVAGFRDGTVVVWNLVEAEPVVYLRAHGAAVLDVAVTPDGRRALSAARDGTLVLWDLVDAAEIQRLRGHSMMVYDVAFTDDGHRALSCSGAASPGTSTSNATVKLWDLQTGDALRSFEIPIGVLFQVAVSPNGKTALVSSPAPVVSILDVGSFAQAGVLAGHEGWVPCLEFAPDGRQALSCSVDGTLIVWDLQNREVLHRLAAHGQGLWSIAVSPDGRTALSDSGDSTGEASMILWNLETGQKTHTFSRSDQPTGAGVGGIAYLPDGRSAISCEGDGLLIEWDLETGEEIRRLGTHSSLRTRIVVAPDGRLALTSGMDGTLALWDLETGEAIRRWGGHGAIFDIAIAPDGQTALVGSSDTTIVQWRLGNPSLNELREWIQTNRYVRGLTCQERELYQVEPLCDSTGAKQATQR